MKLPDGWRYYDGSVWPTLNALKAHLMSQAEAEAESGVPAWVREAA